jgi:4-hydroxy-tetrahydrodipicolinate reductase
MKTIKVLQVGMGPLGQKITQFILERKNLEITGAVDIDPIIIGKNLGELCSVDLPGIQISGSVKDAIKENKPDVAILTTGSSMKQIVPQLEEIISFGIPVVSTSEELTYPWRSSPESAQHIDEFARKHGVAIVGTGVNPGFLMDTLPITLTAVCRKVYKIKVTRIQDAAPRRLPFQLKIGAGLTVEEFENKKKQSSFGHAGLRNSLEKIAGHMGWEPTKVEESMEPVIAGKKMETGSLTIEKGDAAGIEQIARGYVNEEEKITLIFRAAVGEPKPHDTIEIDGDPPIVSTIEGGVHGDTATCAIVLNTLKQIIHAPPGLKTMAELPHVSFFNSG